MNPLNDYQLDSSITRATRWDTTPAMVTWAKTVWRRWILKQEPCCVTYPFKIGDRVRTRRIRDPKHWADLSLSDAGYGAERRRLRFAEAMKENTIPLTSVFDDIVQYPDEFVYEVEVYPTVWCFMHSAWQWRVLATSPTFDWWVADGREQLRMLFDWMRARPDELPKDMSRLSVEQAQQKCSIWHDLRERREAEKAEDPGERREIAPGIHQLLDEQALWYEGNHMHHCVASYWPDVQQGHSLIFHIDEPRATIEVRDGWIDQAKGPCNEYIEMPKAIHEAIAKYVTIDLNRPIENVNTDHDDPMPLRDPFYDVCARPDQNIANDET